MRTLILGIVLLSGLANAKTFEVEKLSTEVRSFECGTYCEYRHAFLPADYEIRYSLIQDARVKIFDYIILDQRFFLDGAHKVRYAGLEYRLGFEIPIKKDSSIEFGKWHHSSHALDKVVRDGEFPLQDGLYLKFNWIKK